MFLWNEVETNVLASVETDLMTTTLCRQSPRRGPTGQKPAVRCIYLPMIPAHIMLLLLVGAAYVSWASDCLPIGEASQHVGETKCVRGKVLHVKDGVKGVRFLDFCEEQIACPFTVVVFSHDLKDVGDIRRLEGRTIEVRGPVKLYDNRAEIILNRISQITGGAAMIPPMPKTYDVENRGHYSAGHLRPAKKPKKTKPTPAPTATYGDVEDQEPPD